MKKCKKLKSKIAIIGTVATLCSKGIIYPQTFIITDINEKTDIVTISTCTGIEYQFTGINDYINGDFVSCVMYNNFSENINDDIILSHKYSGYMELYETLYNTP